MLKTSHNSIFSLLQPQICRKTLKFVSFRRWLIFWKSRFTMETWWSLSQQMTWTALNWMTVLLTTAPWPWSQAWRPRTPFWRSCQCFSNKWRHNGSSRNCSVTASVRWVAVFFFSLQTNREIELWKPQSQPQHLPSSKMFKHVLQPLYTTYTQTVTMQYGDVTVSLVVSYIHFTVCGKEFFCFVLKIFVGNKILFVLIPLCSALHNGMVHSFRI